MDSINKDRKDFHRAAPEEVRHWYFGNEPNASWSRPGWSVAGRKISYFIYKQVYQGSRLDREDLFQSVYTILWEDFDKIVDAFRNSGRVQTWLNLEYYLDTTVKRKLIDMVKRELRHYARTVELGPESDLRDASEREDPVRENEMKVLYQQALAELAPMEKALIVGRLVKGKSIEELAETAGLTKREVFKKLDEIKIKLRHGVLNSGVSERLSRMPGLAEKLGRMGPVSKSPGGGSHKFRITPEKISRITDEFQTDPPVAAESENEERLILFAETVRGVLNDWSFYEHLGPLNLEMEIKKRGKISWWIRIEQKKLKWC